MPDSYRVLTTDGSVPLCPGCGSISTGAGTVRPDTAPPVPGDYSICVVCGVYLRFADNLSLVEVTEADVRRAKEVGELEVQDAALLIRMHHMIRTKRWTPPARPQ